MVDADSEREPFDADFNPGLVRTKSGGDSARGRPGSRQRIIFRGRSLT